MKAQAVRHIRVGCSSDDMNERCRVFAANVTKLDSRKRTQPKASVRKTAPVRQKQHESLPAITGLVESRTQYCLFPSERQPGSDQFFG